MTSFSLAERCVIHPLLKARSAHLEQERNISGRAPILYRATWEVEQRVWAASLSIFAAMDVCIHLVSGIHKTTCCLGNICHLNTPKYSASEIGNHFRQAIWFLFLTCIGSIAGVVWPGV